MGVVVVDFVESWPGITLALGDLWFWFWCWVGCVGCWMVVVGCGEMRLELNAFANQRESLSLYVLRVGGPAAQKMNNFRL